MAKVNYKALLQHYEHHVKEAGGDVEKGCALMESEVRQRFAEGDLSPGDVSLSELFVEAYGWHNFHTARANPGCSGPKSTWCTTIMEAAGGVTTAAFANIGGQIVYNKFMEGYQNEEFVFTKLIPEYKSDFQREKFAMITPIGDRALRRGEAEAYTIAGVGQDWIHGPTTEDRGLIVPCTWEAIFFDRTGQLTKMASDTGHAFGIGEEKRAVDTVIDENAGAVSNVIGGHRYNWRDVDVGATYANDSGNHNFDNLVGSNTLVDWTSVDAAEQTLNQITDPNTGEPVVIEAKHLVVPKTLSKTGDRIKNATEVRVTTPGYAVSSNPSQALAPNPYAGKFEVVTSRYVYNRMATKTNWFYGDVTKAFLNVYNRKMDVTPAPTNNMDEFNRRIVLQWRASKHSNFMTWNPRFVTKNTVGA